MERVFSVDDILGTFWKLDTQGEGGPGGGHGSHVDLQKLHREHSITSGNLPHAGSLGRTGSTHRMSRSSSEWAFQEFLKEHVAASGALAGGGGSENLSLGGAGPAGGALGVSQDDKDGEHDSDEDGSPKASIQAHLTGGAGFGPVPSDRAMPTLDGHRGSEASSTLPPGASGRMAADVAPSGSGSIPPDHRLPPGSMPRPQERSGLGHIPGPSGLSSEAVTSSEAQSSGAMLPPAATGVRPLFQGLHEDAAVTNPQEYEKMLKQQLAVACAMASTRVRSGSSSAGPKVSRPQPIPHGLAPPGSMAMPAPPPVPRRPVSTTDSSGARSGLMAAPPPMPAPPPVGIPALPPKPGYARYGQVGQGLPSTSSSREPSDEEDQRSEGEDELVASLEHVTDPDEIKRIKRMLSNRESARRSRRRKQAHLSDLEAQVAQLQTENSNLASRLGDIGRKYNEAAVDNRVLKSDVEALRAKVKMAEEMLARAHHMSHYMYAPPYRPPPDPGAHLASSEMPYYPRPLRPGHVSPSPPQGPDMGGPHHPASHSGPHPYVPPPPVPHHQHDVASAGPPGPLPPGPPMMPPHGGPPVDPQGVGSKMERTPSMQRVASLEHLQKRIRGSMRGGWGAYPWEEAGEPQGGGGGGGGGEQMAESHHSQNHQQQGGES